jgi:hypothetical protein
MDGDEFSDVITASNPRFRRLSFVFQILGGQTNRHKRKHLRICANNSATIYYHMRLKPHAIVQLNVIPDD